MSRLFSGAATDKITASSTYTFPTTSTIGAWVYRTGAGGGNLGVVWQRLSTNTRVFNDATNYYFVADWSSADGEWFVTLPSNDAWHHLCLTYDAGSTSNDPVIYIDGASASVTENSGPGGSFSSSSFTLVLGNNGNSNNRNFGGRIAEFVHYNVILGAAEVRALMLRGPNHVRPAARVAYYPLIGRSGEPDFSPTNLSGTLTGTAVDIHPPIARQFSWSAANRSATAGAATRIVPVVTSYARRRR